MDFHPARYRLVTPDDRPPVEGGCRVALGDEGLFVALDGDGERFFYYSDMDRVIGQEYQIHMPCFDGRHLTLSLLGTWYGQALADLRRLRSAQLAKNLLMQDGLPEKSFRGAYSFEAAGGQRHADEACTITLYNSSVVVEPEREDWWSFTYPDVTAMAFDPDTYALRLHLDLGEQVAFRMLGNRFGELEHEIRRLTEALYDRTGALLQERLPETVPQATLHRLARVLRQGKAVPRQQVEAAAPGVWPALEAVLFTGESGEPDTARQEAVAHLCGQASPEHVYVGLREGFTGSAPIFWFVVCFPADGRLAVEVTNESGNATYVYRMEGPPERAVAEVSRALTAVGFRREVISASDDELAVDGRLARYQVALRKVPYVRRLRERFIGKAAHTEAWPRRMAGLLHP